MKKLFTIAVLSGLMSISGLTFAAENPSRVYRPKTCPTISEVQQAQLLNMSDTGVYFVTFLTRVPAYQDWVLLVSNIEPTNSQDFLSLTKLAISTINGNPIQDKTEREITCTYPTALSSKSGKPVSLFILPFNSYIVG